MRFLAAICASLVLGGAAHAGCTLNTRGNALDGEPLGAAAGSSAGGGASVSSSTGGGADTGGSMGSGGGGGCGNVLNDPLNCGVCGLTCSSNNTLVRRCVDGHCEPDCMSGWLDCDKKTNNGCEVSDGEDAHCGACTNDCTQEKGTCKKDGKLRRCACSENTDCGPEAKCFGDTCKCFPGGDEGHHCTFGEYCPAANTCECNGSPYCDDTKQADGFGLLICCPSGCANLRDDASNCGACGKACLTGQKCAMSGCI